MADATEEAPAPAPTTEDAAFPGCESAHIDVVELPDKCAWSNIRKLFQDPNMRDGKVDLPARAAWVRFKDEASARAAATSKDGCGFEDGRWRIPYKERASEYNKEAKAGSYGGAPIKSYGRFPNALSGVVVYGRRFFRSRRDLFLDGCQRGLSRKVAVSDHSTHAGARVPHGRAPERDGLRLPAPPPGRR